MKCKHCGLSIEGSGWAYTHLEGGYRGKMRCDPEDSGLEYGYNAHLADTVCENPCLGAPR